MFMLIEGVVEEFGEMGCIEMIRFICKKEI